MILFIILLILAFSIAIIIEVTVDLLKRFIDKILYGIAFIIYKIIVYFEKNKSYEDKEN